MLNEESTSALSCPFLPFSLHNSSFPRQESGQQHGKLPSCPVQSDHVLSGPDRSFTPRRTAHGLRRGDTLKDQAALSISRIISDTKYCKDSRQRREEKLPFPSSCLPRLTCRLSGMTVLTSGRVRKKNRTGTQRNTNPSCFHPTSSAEFEPKASADPMTYCSTSEHTSTHT